MRDLIETQVLNPHAYDLVTYSLASLTDSVQFSLDHIPPITEFRCNPDQNFIEQQGKIQFADTDDSETKSFIRSSSAA